MAPLSQQKGYFLSDLRVGLLLGDRASNPSQAAAGRPAQFSCFPVEIVAESERSCFWGLAHWLGAGLLIWLAAPRVDQQTSCVIRGRAPSLPSPPLFLRALCGLCPASILGFSFPWFNEEVG